VEQLKQVFTLSMGRVQSTGIVIIVSVCLSQTQRVRSFSASSLCVASRWLTSLSRKLCCIQRGLAVVQNNVLSTGAKSAILDCLVYMLGALPVSQLTVSEHSLQSGKSPTDLAVLMMCLLQIHCCVSRWIRKFNRWKDGVEGKGVNVSMNKTKVMISGESCKEYTILEDGHVVFVVEVLLETQYSVLSIRNGCTGNVVV